MSDIWKELVDITDGTTFFGYAPFNTDTSEAGWQIKRVIRDQTSTTEAWSGDRPNAIWDNRATISYT